MKTVSFILIWILAAWGGVFATTTAKSDKASQPPATDFLLQWNDWITLKKYNYADLRLFILEYRCERRDTGNRRFTVRRIVHWGGGKDSPFNLLFEMKDANRLRNVQAKKKDTVYEMILPRAVTLEENGEVKELDCKVECTLDQGRPRRFTFLADEIPKRFSMRTLQVIYTWDIHTYNAYGEDEPFWVPVEILTEQLIRVKGQHPRPRYAVISERWTLERILAVGTPEVEGLVEVENKVTISDNR